jgi:hypothetical protein
MAVRIAQRPMIGLTLAKQSVNNSLDAMGMCTRPSASTTSGTTTTQACTGCSSTQQAQRSSATKPEPGLLANRSQGAGSPAFLWAWFRASRR